MIFVQLDAHLPKLSPSIPFRTPSCNEGCATNLDTSSTSIKSSASTSFRRNAYWDWVRDQIPRVLIGIGNVMSFRGDHSQAVESYLNAIPYREETLEYVMHPEAPRMVTVTNQLELLRCHRLVVEVHVLIAEELLFCPKGQDVKSQFHLGANGSIHDGLHEKVAKIVIVKAAERLILAKNYYEQAKDQLQDLVFMMAKIEQEENSILVPDSDKKSICHLATMLMEVGIALSTNEDVYQK
eukprot:777626_1